MAYKFPWTNYHELNLDWILETVKKLFAQTEHNNEVVTQYDNRLTEVELTADNAQTAAAQAQSDSAAALSLAQGAQTTAAQAQAAAGQAQAAAGQAQTAAGQAQAAAATAQQTATQAQQTAQNFDGRITQAENNAAEALQAAQAFDEQVQGAITASNNANNAATAALTQATEANRKSAETAEELENQRGTLESIISDGVTSLQEAAQESSTAIETVGQSVLASIPSDYTTLSNLVDKKADVIYNNASGEIASFNDGANNMKIKNLIVNIEPVQDGSGDPSPTNIRPISGHTGAEIEQTGVNYPASDTGNQIPVNWETEAGTIYGGILDVISGDLIANYRVITIDGTNIRCTGGYGASGPLYLPLVNISNYKSVSPWTCYCDKLKPARISDEVQTVDNTIMIGNAGNGIAIHIAGIQGTDGSHGYYSAQEVIDAANTWIQSNPITVCYLLETGTHYNLTPQQVKTFYQYNNIWSDVGPVSVTYPADTKIYIDNKFTELQALILEH